MNIGIDFGSTYSLISTFNEQEQKLEELKPDGLTAITPSHICFDKEIEDNVQIGTSAKSSISDSLYKHFYGFKMMLNEKNDVILKEKGYDIKHTPKYVTKQFIKEMLNGILLQINTVGKGLSIADSYDNVYVCVPELWSRNARTMDGCRLLREIFEELNIPNLKIVMEPEAASAYFAYNYEKQTGEKFNGHLFLVDFGGGTLDITLSKIETADNGIITITKVLSDGEGENHKDHNGITKSGKAGMMYLQSLIISILNKNGVNYDIDTDSPKFKEAVSSVERVFMGSQGVEKIRSVFSKFGKYDNFGKIFQTEFCDDSKSENIFARFSYNDKFYRITYADLFEVYQKNIEDVLKSTIKRVCKDCCEEIHKDPCTVEAGESNDFKIALVGGFGSFYFVQKQVESIFNIRNKASDGRTKGLSVSENEKAISYGAALLSAGKVVIRKTAPYSLGIQLRDRNNPNIRRLMYSIKYHDEIKQGEKNYIKDKNNNTVLFQGAEALYKHLVTNHTLDSKVGSKMAICDNYIHDNRLPDDGREWEIGFSLDENYIITLHMRSADDPTIEKKYVFDNYEKVFGELQIVEQIHDGEIIEGNSF